MACLRLFKKLRLQPSPTQDTSGIALFIVLSTVSVLAILVTEFLYTAQVHQAIAFGSLDQLKADTLAKTGFKLSLLRLKAYQQAKQLSQQLSGTLGSSVVSPGVLQKIWSVPLVYPIPAAMMGLNTFEKQVIESFQKNSSLEGSFSAKIETQSARYPLHSLLPPAAPITSSPRAIQREVQPTPSPIFDAAVAREGLTAYLTQLWTQQKETHPEWAALHPASQVETLVDQIAGWSDRHYQSSTLTAALGATLDPSLGNRPKGAPFYSISELHLLPIMEDDLYLLFAPHLKTGLSMSINLNRIDERTLRAWIPRMTAEELKDFFLNRNGPSGNPIENVGQSHEFKNEQEFYSYLRRSVQAYENTEAIEELKRSFNARQITLTTEDQEFLITVEAHVNQSKKTWIAAVSFESPHASTGQTGASGMTPGLRVTDLKIF